MTLYHSTNKFISSYSDNVSFETALFSGIAPDNGLFVPNNIPKFSFDEIKALKDVSYSDIAFAVLNKFLKNEINDKDLKDIIQDAYNFEIPFERFDDNTSIVRLDKGPTLSFKDFAARFMARAMQVLKKNDNRMMIIVATSGDTGSAIGSSFRGLEGIDVVILYPKNEVTNFQKYQMNSLGKNIKTIEVDGKFDDCQKMVKEAFNDSDLEHIKLTSANSINIGRILPQIVYYFYSFLQCSKDFSPIIFSVPSGNFGNSLGCEIARRMGLPVKAIIIAVNENDEFPRFLDAGQYHKISPSRSCLSNAMNVGNPSNLARYFEFYGGCLDKDGTVHKMPDINQMKQNIFSVSVTDEETIKTMQNVYQQKSIILEPHGAVGFNALGEYRKQTKDDSYAVVLETADPIKFSESVENILNIDIKLDISSNIDAYDKIGNNYNEFKYKLLNL